ncbi:reverse transcriptase domain-containing protein [Tanacetum coccineum]|uniref:Reverse transcriptase domain-containing protein n=1 Tax=Tanacetum coccineum TaxID=301880 RepID=A0ABQ5G5P6_9ASTR
MVAESSGVWVDISLNRGEFGEYMERFTRLASFVGTAAGDAQRQARHFKWGLKKWVLDRIINTDYTNVAQVAAAARNIELLHESGNSNKRDRDGNRIQNRGHGQQENKGHHDQGQHEYRGRQDQSVEHQGRQDWGYDSKRQDFWGQDQRFDGRNGNDYQGQGNYNQRQHRGQSTRDFNQGHASGSANQRRSTETLPPLPLCTTCGKPHLGVCYKATGGCFTCGSTQHKVKDCSQAKQKQNMPTDFARLPPATGRVYTTTRDQAAKTSGTITGNLYIDDHTVFVLFDTGATHSIISTTFAKKLNMTPTPLIEPVIISTPMKNHMLIDHEYVNCPLRFDDRIRPTNLLPIHMLDIDVILGMNWLASHRATIDCYARTIIFGNVRQPEFVYHGEVYAKVYQSASLVTGKVAFLVHIVSADGIIMDPSKVILAQMAVTYDSVTEIGLLRSDIDSSPSVPVVFRYTVMHQRKGWLPLVFAIEDLEDIIGFGGYWASMRIESNLMLQIKEAQRDDGKLWAIVQNVEDGKHIEFSVDDDGVVWFKDRLCVPNDQALREKVKIKHQRASGLLQPLEIPMWKWDEIFMDFVSGLPTTQKRHDAIWVVVDRLTKSAHFLPIRKNYGIRLQKGLGELVLSSRYSDFILKPHGHVREEREEDHAELGRYVEAWCFRMDRNVEHLIFCDENFKVGGYVFLKVLTLEEFKRFGSRASLCPRFIGPFEILDVLERLSYRLAITP